MGLPAFPCSQPASHPFIHSCVHAHIHPSLHFEAGREGASVRVGGGGGGGGRKKGEVGEQEREKDSIKKPTRHVGITSFANQSTNE